MTDKTTKKRPRKRGFRATMKRWKTGDFFRQLATVIIGILITFGGGSLIQRRAEKKQTNHLLSLVRDELRLNLEETRSVMDTLRKEMKAAQVFNAYMDIPDRLPADTLTKHQKFFTHTVYLNLSDNAFEVLKNSSQIRSTRNKDLLLDIFTIYDRLYMLSNGVNEYSELKNNRINLFISSLDTDQLETGQLFGKMIKLKQIRNFIITTYRGIGIGYLFDQAAPLVIDVEKVIEKINKEIGDEPAVEQLIETPNEETGEATINQEIRDTLVNEKLEQ